jgi:riboflavin kinase/FMN adenylyltransferase
MRDCHSAQQLQNCVATIGNFDGLHLGHRTVIAKVVQIAKEQNLVPTVITFHPLPQTYLRPDKPTLRLLSLRQKIEQLASMGIKQIVCLRFNETLSKLSPLAFIEEYLVKALKVRCLLVGEDFRFGHKQAGNIDTLQLGAQTFGFILKPLTLLQEKDNKISSTDIRHALVQGDMPRVKALLGRNYRLKSRVKPGAQRGRLLGFPTVNFSVPKNQRLLAGVFASKVIIDDKSYWGVTNAGTRPTVDGKHYLIETHILDFNQNVYGKMITVEFLNKIRDEMRFNDVEELKQRIQQDIQEALGYFNIPANMNMVEEELER